MNNEKNSAIPMLFEIMEQKEISAYRLSKDIGVSQGNISDWKHGNKTPNMHTLIKLADYFDVSIDYLVGRSDKKEL